MKNITLIFLLLSQFISSIQAQEKIDERIQELHTCYQTGKFNNLIKKGRPLKDDYEQIDVNKQYLHFFLGLAYKKKNEEQNANREFLELLELNPDFEPVLFATDEEDKDYFEDFKNMNLGALHIFSDPSLADVYINGKLMGKTPLIIDKILSSSYNIIIFQRDHEIHEENITVKSGETLTITTRLNYSTSSGPLTITSNPPGALVYIDTIYAGITPLQLKDFKSGLYTFTVIKDEYKNYKKLFHKTDNVSYFDIQLKKDKDSFDYFLFVPGLSQFMRGYKTHGILSISVIAGYLAYFKSNFPQAPPEYKLKILKIYGPTDAATGQPSYTNYYINEIEVSKEEYEKEELNKLKNDDEWRKHNEEKTKFKALGIAAYAFNLLDAIIVMKYDQSKKRKKQNIRLGFRGDKDKLSVSLMIRF